MNTKVWLQAFRLRTLPLALSSIAMGGFLASAAGAFQWGIFLLCVLTTIFLQILSNLANDYGDSIHGADSADRKGPARAVQSGRITAGQMRAAVIIFVLLSLASGISLLFFSFGLAWNAILFFLGLGLLSIGAAIAYTVGRKPYGYIGLGDLSVLIFFGLVGVMGSYYLFTKAITPYEVLPALSCGLFSIAVLNVNNIRDIESDRKAGKYSIPVRIGRDKAVAYHWCLLVGGVLCAVLYTVFHYQSPTQFLFLASVPLFVRNGLAVTHKPSTALDPFLKQMAMSTLLFVLLFGAGLLLA
ncbi:1,4-dihydroxy-2-naphthoate polyprenyltransferase [Dawidia soli]|uniref:1,4-dihydroxy-2-naphthoate octaprenyltransferase n=1 Tax=Dawidia soli TaxID=2782352 RepID=A0AAP2GEC3_9BACT|nr:1,4-dihydroxy-2-naphthoate polyprenyltransferase [Dawidia soli]MBT1688234.1 1,4-dihydroxy-2-naphthoate polyprenyltransferase [Dawidia soli]